MNHIDDNSTYEIGALDEEYTRANISITKSALETIDCFAGKAKLSRSAFLVKSAYFFIDTIRAGFLETHLNDKIVGSAGTITELLSDYLHHQCEDSMFTGKTIAFIAAIVRPLVYLRNTYNVPIKLTTFEDLLTLSNFESFVYDNEFNHDEHLVKLLTASDNYLKTLPGYDPTKTYNQDAYTQEQFGYIAMELQRVLEFLKNTPTFIVQDNTTHPQKPKNQITTENRFYANSFNGVVDQVNSVTQNLIEQQKSIPFNDKYLLLSNIFFDKESAKISFKPTESQLKLIHQNLFEFMSNSNTHDDSLLDNGLIVCIPLIFHDINNGKLNVIYQSDSDIGLNTQIKEALDNLVRLASFSSQYSCYFLDRELKPITFDGLSYLELASALNKTAVEIVRGYQQTRTPSTDYMVNNINQILQCIIHIIALIVKFIGYFAFNELVTSVKPVAALNKHMSTGETVLLFILRHIATSNDGDI